MFGDIMPNCSQWRFIENLALSAANNWYSSGVGVQLLGMWFGSDGLYGLPMRRSSRLCSPVSSRRCSAILMFTFLETIEPPRLSSPVAPDVCDGDGVPYRENKSEWNYDMFSKFLIPYVGCRQVDTWTEAHDQAFGFSAL